jgi:hypothetical protein
MPTVPSESQNCPAVLHTATLDEQSSSIDEQVNVVLSMPSGAAYIALDGRANELTPDPVNALLLIERTSDPH